MRSLFLVLAFFLIVPMAHGRTWVVDEGGNGDFTEIQDAVNASSDGDIIKVRTGHYSGFYVDRSLLINGTEATVNGSILIHSNSTAIRGFEARKLTVNGSHIEVENLHLHGFDATINGSGKDLIFRDVHVSGTYCTAISLEKAQNIWMVGITVDDINGTGMDLRETEGLHLQELIFREVSTGIVADGREIFLSNITFWNCTQGMELSTINATLSDITIEDASLGIRLKRCDQLDMKSLELKGNDVGVKALKSENVTICDTTIHGSDSGIILLGVRRLYAANLTIYNVSLGILLKNCVNVSLYRMTVYDAETGLASKKKSGYDEVNSGLQVDNSTFSHCIVGLYFEYSDSGYVNTTTITECETGIMIRNHATQMNILWCIIRNNTLGVDFQGGSTVASVYMHYCMIEWNKVGVNESGWSAGVFFGERNWWGATSGPKWIMASNVWGAEGNPNGTGDVINGDPYGIFKDWLTLPPDYKEAVIDVIITPEIQAFHKEVTFQCSGWAYRGIVRYIWSSDVDGVIYNSTEPIFTADNLSIGRHNITLTIIDGIGVEYTFNATVEITSPHAAEGQRETKPWILGALPFIIAFVISIVIAVALLGKNRR